LISINGSTNIADYLTAMPQSSEGGPMTYKTVLIHCNDKSRIRRIIAPAVQVAAQAQAHLIGVSVTPPVVIIPTGMPGAPDTMVVDDHCREYRKDNPDMKLAFEAAAVARNLVAEWLEADAGSMSVADGPAACPHR
jgi:hypothetical protein